jgi:CheY-like chemotaxis protein
VDELRGDPTTRHIPIILWSAAVDALEAHALELRSKYAVFVLPRPLDLATLLVTIAEATAAPAPVVGRNS